MAVVKHGVGRFPRQDICVRTDSLFCLGLFLRRLLAEFLSFSLSRGPEVPKRRRLRRLGEIPSAAAAPAACTVDEVPPEGTASSPEAAAPPPEAEGHRGEKEGEAEVTTPPPTRSDVSPMQPEGTPEADAASFTPSAKERAAVTGASAGASADVEMERSEERRVGKEC